MQASSVDNGQDKIGLGIRAANWRAPEARGVVVRRRVFIGLLGGAMVWPLQARAQQPTRRIGMLIGYAEGDPQIQARLAAFRQGLENNGWKEGRNINIDYRFAPAGPDQAQVFAKELVALQLHCCAKRALSRSCSWACPIQWAAILRPASRDRVAAQPDSPISHHR